MGHAASKIGAFAFLLLSSLLVLGQTKPSAAAGGKHYQLPATKDTVQWGWLDPHEKPKLTVNSGDTVSVETWYHAEDQIKPSPIDHTIAGPPMDELVRLRKANDGGGPHSLTGPSTSMAPNPETPWRSAS